MSPYTSELREGTLFAERYRLLKHLGSGSYGEVWHAFDTEMDMDIAIKIYITLDREAQDQFKNEYRVVYGVHDDYLLTADYYGVWSRRPYLTMKYCERGSVSSLRGALYNENIIWQFIHDVAQGLRHLHSLEPPILHQDIKPANILIDDQDRFLLTDFGISRRMRSTLRKASRRSVGVGALAYMAPERFINDPIAVKASDIWSLGASVYELATGELPLMGQGGSMLLAGGKVEPLDPSRWSRRLNDVVMACMDTETWNRPTAEQLVTYSSMMLAGDTTPWKAWFGEKETTVDEPLEISSFEPVAAYEPARPESGRTRRIKTDDQSFKPTPVKRRHTAAIVWICFGLLVAAAALYSYFSKPSEDIMSIYDRVEPENTLIDDEPVYHQDIDTTTWGEIEEVVEVVEVTPDSMYDEPVVPYEKTPVRGFKSANKL